MATSAWLNVKTVWISTKVIRCKALPSVCTICTCDMPEIMMSYISGTIFQKDATAAKEYERLKLDLWEQYEHDRDAYTLHKSDFIKHYTEQGKRLFPDRYK